MLFQNFDWDLTHQVLFLYIYFAQPSYELERPALENAHTLVQRTDIFREHVYMRPEVNSNRFEISNRFEMSIRLHVIYMEISLWQLSKQWQGSNAHVQMISFNYGKLN